MGRGNVCTHGKYEGLYYVDRDYLDIYTSKEPDEDNVYNSVLQKDLSYEDFDKYDYDEYFSRENYNDFIQDFTSLMEKRFKSFTSTGEDYGVIMENSLFEIQIEDNEWSYAVKLIQKGNTYDNYLEGLQKKHYKTYLNGIRDVLLELFPEIGTYSGAWTSGRLTREDLKEVSWLTIYSTYEDSITGEYTETEMKKLYEKEVDKKEYSTFEGWVWDMLRSGVFNKK